jgi:NADH:ubiquinone oxidoreductase subunit K
MHIYRLFVILFFLLFVYLSLFYNRLNLIMAVLIIEILFITLVMLLLTAASYWYNPVTVCFALIILIFSAVEFSVLLAIVI